MYGQELQVVSQAWVHCVNPLIAFAILVLALFNWFSVELVAFTKKVNPESIRTAIRRLLPNHHTHELRYTFITRCKECGVNPEVVMLWDGHTFDKDVKTSAVDRGYTTYSLKYLIEQSKLVKYDF